MSDETDDLIISISTDQATLRRSIQRIESQIDGLAGGVRKQFEKVGKAIDDSMATPLQQRIQAMVGIGTKAAKEWNGVLADQGAELDRLRAKYNPLFATFTKARESMAEIRRAYAIGAISSTEYAAAMSKERTAALASAAAIKARNAVIADTPARMNGAVDTGTQARRQNLGYQAFDIGQGLASGLPIPMILAQQGPQIAQMYAGQGGIKAALKDMAAIAASAVSAVGPLGIAFGAAAAAATAYYSISGSKAVETLQRQRDLIDEVAGKWGDSLPALKAYNEELKRGEDATKQRDAIAAGIDLSWASARDTVKDFGVEVDDALDKLKSAGASSDDIISVQEAWNKLKERVDANKATFEDVRAAQVTLALVMNQNGIPAIDGMADSWARLLKLIDDASGRMKRLASDLADPFKASEEATKKGQAYTDALLKIQQAEHDAYNPVNIAPGVNIPTPGDRPQNFYAPIDSEDKEATKSSNAYRDLIKSAQDRIDQLQLETDLLGKFGIEADTARFRLDLLQQSEDKGRSLSPKQLDVLEQKVALYGKMSTMLAEVKLQQDLANDARFNSLSPQDREIASRLRQYGLPEDLNGKNADSIRRSLQYSEVKDGVKTFMTDLENGLLSNGGDIGKALGNAMLNALNNQLQKQFDAIADKLASSVAQAFLGKSAPAVTGVVDVGGMVSKAITPANSNSSMPVTGDIASYIAKAATARGIDPDVALRVARSEGGTNFWNRQSDVIKNGVREPSFGPYQLYMNGGLGNKFKAQTGLDPSLAENGPAGVDFALDYAKKNGWSSWYGARNTGISKWEGINPGVDPMATSAVTQNLSKLSTNLSSASKNVSGFGQGLGSLGQKLSSGFPSAPAPSGQGGGLFGWLGSLFGGFKPNGAQASLAASGSIVGLFAGGGHVFGPGGPTSDKIPAMLSNGEFVVNSAMTKKHRAMLEAINSGRLAHLADGGLVTPRLVPVPVAPTLAPRMQAANGTNQPVQLNVHVHGGSGDDHIRALAKQGAGEALSNYDAYQRRTGFGDMQQKWTARKG